MAAPDDQATAAEITTALNAVRSFFDIGFDADKDDFFGSSIVALQDLTIYQGMNAKLIAALLIKRGGGFGDAFKRDLMQMIAFLCERGTNLAEIRSKSTEAGKIALANLEAKYHLVSKVSKEGGVSITLARVGAVFPYLTCRYMEVCANPTVPDSRIDVAEYPKVMKTSAFASLIPKSDILSDEGRLVLVNLHAYHQAIFSQIINRKNKDKKDTDLGDWWTDVKTYIAAAMEADYISEGDRVRALLSFKLIKADNRDKNKYIVRPNVVNAWKAAEIKINGWKK